MSTRKFWSIFGGSFLAAGLIALLAGLYATYRAYGDAGRLAHEGQVADGIVLERKIQTRQDSNGMGAGRGNSRPTEFYSLVYRFTTVEGQTLTEEAGVDRATWDRLVERSPVGIIYVPGAPGINALAGHEPEWALVLMAPLLGLIFGALGGFILMRARRQGSGALPSDTAAESTRRDRRRPGTESDSARAVQRPALPPRTRRLLLLVGACFCLVPFFLLGLLCQTAYEDWRYAHDGTAASCAVTGKSIVQADAGRNSSTRYLVHCQFATAAGKTVEGHYALPVAAWERLTSGGALAITYLPADPGLSQLAGDDFGAEIAGVALMIPLAAGFLLIGGLCLQRARSGPWRELWSRVPAPPAEAAPRSTRRTALRPPAAPAPAARRFPRLGVGWIWIPAYVVVSLLAAPLADSAAMRAVDSFVDAHRLWLLVPAIPLVALGFILFMGSGLALLMDEGKPLSREELDAFYRAQGTGDPTGPGLGWRWQVAVDDGGVIAARDAFRLADLKRAWRAGLLRRPPFPRRLAKVAGGVMLLLGGAGAIFALGSGLTRIMITTAALLAFGWVARALARS